MDLMRPPPVPPGSLLLVLCVTMAAAVLSASFAIFPVREAASGGRALQAVAGALPSAHWAAALAADLLLFAVRKGGGEGRGQDPLPLG